MRPPRLLRLPLRCALAEDWYGPSCVPGAVGDLLPASPTSSTLPHERVIPTALTVSESTPRERGRAGTTVISDIAAEAVGPALAVLGRLGSSSGLKASSSSGMSAVCRNLSQRTWRTAKERQGRKTA